MYIFSFSFFSISVIFLPGGWNKENNNKQTEYTKKIGQLIHIHIIMCVFKVATVILPRLLVFPNIIVGSAVGKTTGPCLFSSESQITATQDQM